MIHPISPETLPVILQLEARRTVVDDSSLYWSDRWEPTFYAALAREGFISIALRDPELGELLLAELQQACLLYTSPSPRDKRQSRMPSSA